MAKKKMESTTPRRYRRTGIELLIDSPHKPSPKRVTVKDPTLKIKKDSPGKVREKKARGRMETRKRSTFSSNSKEHLINNTETVTAKENLKNNLSGSNVKVAHKQKKITYDRSEKKSNQKRVPATKVVRPKGKINLTSPKRRSQLEILLASLRDKKV